MCTNVSGWHTDASPGSGEGYRRLTVPEYGKTRALADIVLPEREVHRRIDIVHAIPIAFPPLLAVHQEVQLLP